MAELDKVLENEQRVENKMQDAESLYNDAANAANESDWLKEQQAKLDALKPQKQGTQPQQPASSSWLDEQQKKLDAIQPQQEKVAQPVVSEKKVVTPTPQGEPQKKKPVDTGLTPELMKEAQEYNKGGVDVDSKGRVVQNVDGQEYRFDEEGGAYRKDANGDILKIDNETVTYKSRPRDTSEAPHVKSMDTWRYTNTIKYINDSPLHKAALHTNKFLTPIYAGEREAIIQNKDYNSLLSAYKELDNKWKGRDTNNTDFEHDAQIASILANQMVALELGYNSIDDMNKNPGERDVRMYASHLDGKTKAYYEQLKEMADNGADLEAWNPFLGDLPENVAAIKESDRKEGKDNPDNYYSWLAIRDKDFNDKWKAWALAYAGKHGMSWKDALNYGAKHFDRQHEAFVEKEADEMADSWWSVPYAAWLNSGLGEFTSTIMRGWDSKGVDMMYEISDRAQQKMSGGQMAAVGVMSLGFDVAPMAVGSGVGAWTVKGLSTVTELSPTAARIMIGSLGFANYEASKAILDATSRGKPIEGAEVVAGFFRGAALGGATSYASNLIGGAFTKASDNAVKNWLATTRAGNYTMRGIGKGAEFGIFAGSEIIGELAQGKSLKDIEYGTIALNNGAMIISMSLGHHLAGAVTGKSGFKRKISNDQISRIRALGYDNLADEMVTFNNMGFRNKPFGGYSEAAMKELEALRDRMTPGSSANWTDYAAALFPTGNIMTQPGVDNVTLDKIDGKYVIVSKDQNGVEIGRKTYTKERTARRDYDKAQKAVSYNSERANEESFAMQRSTHIQAEAARAVADVLNERDGVSAYNEDGTPNPNYMGWTASAINRAFERISKIPAEERTAEDNALMDMFDREMERLDSSAVTTADMRRVICEQYGITEEKLGEAWNKDADQRNAKEKEICAAYNAVLSRPYEINTGRKTGEAVVDGRKVEVVSRIEYDDNGNARPSQKVFYRGEDGKIYEAPAERVTDVTASLDTGAAADKISQDNQSALYDSIVESSRGEVAGFSDDQLLQEIYSMSHIIEAGGDKDGSLTIRMNILVNEYGKREAERYNNLSDAEKAEALIGERLPGVSEERKKELMAYYQERPLELRAAIEYPSTHNMEIKALVDSKGIKDSAKWKEEYEKYAKDDESFREDFKKAFSKEASREPFGFEREAIEAVTEEIAPDVDQPTTETVETETEAVEPPTPTETPEAPTETPSEGGGLLKAFGLDGTDNISVAWQEYWRANPPKDAIDVLSDVMGVDRTENRAALENNPAELQRNWTETFGENGPKLADVSAEIKREQMASVPQPEATNEMKPAEVPEVETKDVSPTPEPAKDKIDELLDFMGLEGEERESLRRDYENDSESFNADYAEYEAQKQEPKREPVQEVEEEKVDDSQQEPEIVDDLDAPMPTKDVKGKQKPDYSKTTPRKGHDYLFNKSGLEKEEALDKVDYEISKAKDKVKALEKKQPNMKDKRFDGDVDEYLQAKAEWENELGAAKAEQKYWEDVQDIEEGNNIVDKLESPPTGEDGRRFLQYVFRRFSKDREISNILERQWTPRSLEEAVVVSLAANDTKLIWSDEKLKGVKEELGWKNGERRKFLNMLASKEKGGMTISKLSEKIASEYADGAYSERQPEVRDMILETLRSAPSKGALKDIVNRWKFQEIADILRKRAGEDVQSSYDAKADEYYDKLGEEEMQRENEGEQTTTEQQSNEADNFLEQRETDVPFSLKQEQTMSKETITGDVRTRLEEKVGKELTDRIENIAKSLGVRVRFTDKDVNGFMDYEDGILYIGKDIDSNKTETFVVGHELTHEMKMLSDGKNSEVYNTFKDAALDWAKEHKEEGGKGYDADWIKGRYEEFFREKYKKEALRRGMTEAEADAYAEKRAKERVTDDFVNNEIVANVAGHMLENPAITEEMFKLKEAETPQERRSRLRRLLDWIKEYIAKRIGNKKPEELTPEEQQLLELRDKFNDMYNEVVREDLDTQGIETSENGDARDYSIRTLTKEEQREDIIEGLMEHTGRSREDVEKWLESESSLATMILGDPENLDYAPDPRDPAIKKNSDYPQGTVDFSNICRKRKDFTNIYTILQKENPNRVFTALDLEEMRQAMIEDGYTVACGLCFVEDRRQLLGEIAEDFIDRLKNNNLKPVSQNKIGDDKYVPTIAELITPEGSKRLAEEHPAVWEAFRAHNNARGQQAGRLYEGYNEYKREILNWSDDKVKKVNDVGGLRIFSFSDFEAPQLLDIIQIIEDCGARGVKIQGYTKVPEFAKAIKDTGVKLNQSLIPKGDGVKVVDGKEVLDYDPVEGIDVNDKNFVNDPDNPNVGTILVGINDKQIRLAMQDPFVDYIIPFHTKIAKEVLSKKGIGEWVNYKNFQRDHDISTGRAAEKEINIYTDVLQAAEAEGKPITNKVEFVNKFLEVAKERGLEPRFSQFLDKDANGNYIYTEGYHKFLVDFKLFDKEGNIIPQEVVKPEFDDAFNKEILDNYAKDAKIEKDYGATLDKLRGRLGLDAPKRTHYEDIAEEYSLKEDEKKVVPSSDLDGNKAGEENVLYSLHEIEGKKYSDEEIDGLLEKTTKEAVPMPDPIEYNLENWDKEFPNGKLKTPFGEIKLSDEQYKKTDDKNRKTDICMIKPTLTDPDFIISVPSEAKEGQVTERPSTYLFVKAFVKRNGEKVYFHKSVTNKKDGLEVNMSNHIDRPKRIKNELKEGKLLYRKDGGAQTEQHLESASVATSQDESRISANKVTTETSNLQEKREKTTENGEYSLKDEVPTSDLAARMRERALERMRARSATNTESTEPRTETGGAGSGEPPVEPPTPPTPPTPEPAPELPPTDYDRPMTAIEQAQAAAIKAVNDTKASLEQRNAARSELGRSLSDLNNQIKRLASYGDKVEAVKAELQVLKSQYGTMPRDEYRQRKAEIEKKLNRLFKGKRFWKGIEAVGDEIENNGASWASNMLRQVEATQKEYDRTTVENVVSLCKMMVKSGLIDHSYISNLTPLFTKLKDVTGKQDVTSTVNGIMDVMLKSQERSIRNEIAKLLNTKGVKVDKNGVVTQSGLDLRGQHTMKELSEYMGKGSVIIDNHISNLEEERSRIPEGHQERVDDIDDKILGAQLAKQFSEIEETHSVNISEAEQDLNFLKERYRAGEIGVKEYTEQKHALENLIRSYRMAQADALWNQANALRYVIKGSKEGTRNWVEQQKAHKNEIRHNAYSDMEGKSTQTQGDQSVSQRFVNRSIPRFFSSSLYTLQTMLKTLGNKHAMGEGYLYNRFFRGWMKNRDAEITEYRDDMDRLNAKAREMTGHSYFGIYNMIQKLPKMTVEYMDGGEMRPHELDQGQLGYAYMVNKMEDGASALRNMGITEEKMQEIENFLNPELKKFYDWLQDDFLAGKWEGMNEVHKRMFGADMDRVANYIPLKRDRGAAKQEVDISQEGETPLSSTVVGSIIQRVHNNLGVDLKHNNAIDVVANHLLESVHWKHFSEWKRDANTLLSDTKFRNKVKNTTSMHGSGEQLWNRLNQVFQIAGGDYKPAGNKSDIDKAAVALARPVNAAKVSLRVFTATKQLLSLPVFATECNPAILMKNVAFLLSPNKVSGNPAQNSFVWCLQNLPQFRERWVSRIAGETRLENGDLGWGYSRQKIFEALGRIGLTPNAFIDACTVAAGAKSIYEKRYSQYKKDGYSDKVADEKAKIDAEIAFNESQQSSEKAFVSPIQVDRTVAALGLSTFRNASMGYERKFIDAVRNFRHLTDHKESVEFMQKQMQRDGLTETQAKQAAERVYRRALWRSTLNFLMFGFGAQMAWNVGGQLPYLIFGDNDEEKKKRIKEAAIHAGIGGWVEGLPAGDMLSEGMTNWAMNLDETGNPLNGKSFFEFDPDLLTVTSDVVKMVKAIESDNPLKGATDFVNVLAQVYTGANPQTFTDAGIAIYDACNCDPKLATEATMCVLRILQCPQSQLDQMYIDELKMSARDAQKLTPEQVARRYAYYKAHRDAPYLWWIYNQEQKDKIVKKYEDKFSRKLSDDVKEAGGTPEDYRDLMNRSATTKEHDKWKDKMVDAYAEQGAEALRKAWEEETDWKVKKTLMSRYQKMVYKEEKTPTNDEVANNYKSKHGEDLDKQAEKIGRDLGFDAQDAFYQMSHFKTQHNSANSELMRQFHDLGCSFRYSKDGKYFDMEDYEIKLPVKDKAKRAKALKLISDPKNKPELQRIYRNGWRISKIGDLYKKIDSENAGNLFEKAGTSYQRAQQLMEIQQLLDDEANDK